MANELIETLLIYNTFAGSIDIGARVVARRGLVHGHAESNRFPVGSRAEHKVQISPVKSIDDGAVGCAQPRMFCADGPLSVQPSLVETRCARRVAVLLVPDGAEDRGHADEHRQRAAGEGPVSASEHERQHGQNAWADDG